jgi:putative transposase
MPNHFHLVMWPERADQLSKFMQWITATHTKRWHACHRSTGCGPLYQGRFKAFPVGSDRHFLTVCRYVERNALRAGLVDAAERWPWSSLAQRCENRNTVPLHEWPIPQPSNWREIVNGPEEELELSMLRACVRVSAGYGEGEKTSG